MVGERFCEPVTLRPQQKGMLAKITVADSVPTLLLLIMLVILIPGAEQEHEHDQEQELELRFSLAKTRRSGEVRPYGGQGRGELRRAKLLALEGSGLVYSGRNPGRSRRCSVVSFPHPGGG
jgi:hypothetical protein